MVIKEKVVNRFICYNFLGKVRNLGKYVVVSYLFFGAIFSNTNGLNPSSNGCTVLTGTKQTEAKGVKES